MKRCSWVSEKSQLYIDYHDNEWGIPEHNDRKLFEKLSLEIFQAGLNWVTILKKREGFRAAFDNFDVEKIMAYTPDKVQELLENADIIKNKTKIKAIINNAKIFWIIQKEYGSFSNYIWSFTDNKVIKNTTGKAVSENALSEYIASDLKRRGMLSIGSITIYAYLQAIGVIDDHQPGCFKY